MIYKISIIILTLLTIDYTDTDELSGTLSGILSVLNEKSVIQFKAFGNVFLPEYLALILFFILSTYGYSKFSFNPSYSSM